MPHINRTRHGIPWWEYYNEEAARLIRHRYSRDFEAFGYERNLPIRSSKAEILARVLWIGRGEPPPDAIRHPPRTRHGRMELPDACFGQIHLYGVMEMILPDEALALLRECRRVIHPEGVLHLNTLDLDFITDLLPLGYEAGTLQHDFVCTYSGTHLPDSDLVSPAEVINHLMRRNGQRYLYDEALLAELLEQAGFHGRRLADGQPGEIAVAADCIFPISPNPPAA